MRQSTQTAALGGFDIAPPIGVASRSRDLMFFFFFFFFFHWKMKSIQKDTSI